MSLGNVYYDPKHPAGFGSVAKLVKASKNRKRVLEEWLSSQNTYTLHKQVRKRFPRNPYTVTNIDDVWEMDLGDISSLAKYNDKYKYLLNVIDVFSRYARNVHLKDKTAPSITSALKSLSQNWKQITIQSDKATEFVNATVLQYLKRQGLSFHLTQNPDIKCVVIEGFNISLKTRIYKYFTKNNIYRYLDVINKLLTGYNNSVHSTIGMPPTKLNPSNIYSVWKRMNSLWTKIPRGRVKYKVGDSVRKPKEKVKFAKGYEQRFSTEIFRVVKVIRRVSQHVLRTVRLAESTYRRPILQLRACQRHCITWHRVCNR